MGSSAPDAAVHKRRILSIRQKLSGKYFAARTVAEFMLHFSNWREIWDAHRSGADWPMLYLRNGLKLFHQQPEDIPLFLFRELFERRPYTRGGLYRPEPGDVVIDIGANIGWFALSMQYLAPGITVHCFEPAASARERLCRNVNENRLSSKIFVYPFGVSDRNGVARLRHNVHSVVRALALTDISRTDGEDVKIVDFATALAMSGAKRVDLLKIDIEGGEVELMRGSRRGDWSSIRRVAIEFHDALRPGSRDELIDGLRNFGFLNVRCSSDPASIDGSQGFLQASR